MEYHILHIEDSKTDADLVKRIITKSGLNFSYRLATGKKELIEALKAFEPNIILSDHSLPSFNSKMAYELCKEKNPNLPFILVTGTVSEDFAVEMLKMGVDDYLLKSNLQRLPSAITNVLSKKEAEQKLTASLKELSDYKFALDKSSIVGITDQKGIIKHVNDNFVTISKYSREELIGQDHRIINSGYHSSSFIKNIWVTIANGKIWKGEIKNKAKDGSTYWVDTTIVPFLDNEGKPYQYMAIRTDITNRKKLEDLLHKSNELARLGGWEVDLLKGTVYWSNITREIHEAESSFVPDLATGINFYKEGPGRDLITQRVKEAIEHGKPWDEELQIVTVKNNVRWIRTIGEVEFVDGKCVRIFGSFQDIDERKKGEQKIIESENRMRLATSSAKMGIWYWDNKNDKMVWDEKLYQIYDINETQLGSVYEGWLSRLHPEDKDRVNEVMQTAIVAKQSEYNSEFRIIWSDLSVHYIKGTGITEYDDTGNVIGMMGVNWDVTESKKAEEKLIENENYLRSILDNEPECVKVLNSEGELLSINAAGLAMIEADNEQKVLGRHMVDLVNKKYQLGFNQLSKEIFKGNSGTFEFEITGLKGGHRWLETHAVPLKDTTGKIVNLLGVTRDITERKIDEKEKKQLTDRLQLATKSAHLGIWDWDIKNNVLTWDEGMYRLYNIDGNEFNPLYDGWFSRLHPKDKQQVQSELELALANKKDFKPEFRIIWSDLSVHYIKASAIIERDHDGNAKRMIGANWDVTAEKEKERHLKLLESVITNTTDSVLITEAEPFDEPGNRIVFVNAAFSKMTGYSLEEVIGKSPRILQGPKSDKIELQRLGEAIRKWQSFETTLINYKKNGDEFWINFSLTPVANEKGWYTHWIAVERDVTDQKKYISAIENQNIKLREIAWTQSHIVRAPLANMMGIVSLISRDAKMDSSKYAEWVDRFNTCASELDNIIKNISNKAQDILVK